MYGDEHSKFELMIKKIENIFSILLPINMHLQLKKVLYLFKY